MAAHPSALTDLSPNGADSVFDASTLERTLGQRLHPARWIGWRLRLLLAAALIGSVALFLMIRHLGAILRLRAD